ncbi:hypothetical protein WN51_06301 [Melipona quadrifasciata]|uniref:Uncharacterized protein n=1 Tax=Melipona quadrifasciata TaxID=166423 RepID=A0A0N0BCS9_9HYME|nr:hypothetical protein WN51_06301 [Melipona quadrifasciata]
MVNLSKVKHVFTCSLCRLYVLVSPRTGTESDFCEGNPENRDCSGATLMQRKLAQPLSPKRLRRSRNTGETRSWSTGEEFVRGIKFWEREMEGQMHGKAKESGHKSTKSRDIQLNQYLYPKVESECQP